MITQERLKELLDYSLETGEFRWKISKRGLRKYSLAGSISGHGYLMIRLDKKLYRAHRLAWLYVTGKFPENTIDHINGNRSDNRFSNLRDVTRSENQKNLGLNKRSKSGVTVVMWYQPLQKWHVQIQLEKKRVHIGYFDDLITAVAERKRVERLNGFHYNHGDKRGGCDESEA